MNIAEKDTGSSKPPRLLQVRLPEDVDILLRTTAVVRREKLTNLVAAAILQTYGPITEAEEVEGVQGEVAAA